MRAGRPCSTVEQTMTFAAPVPAQVSQRFETQRDLVGDRRQVFTLSDFAATAQGSEVATEVERARVASPP